MTGRFQGIRASSRTGQIAIQIRITRLLDQRVINCPCCALFRAQRLARCIFGGCCCGQCRNWRDRGSSFNWDWSCCCCCCCRRRRRRLGEESCILTETGPLQRIRPWRLKERPWKRFLRRRGRRKNGIGHDCVVMSWSCGSWRLCRARSRECRLSMLKFNSRVVIAGCGDLTAAMTEQPSS